jgi:hypothetical protein
MDGAFAGLGKPKNYNLKCNSTIIQKYILEGGINEQFSRD